MPTATPLKRPTPGVKRPDPAKIGARCALPLHPDHAAALASPLPASVDNSLQPATDQGQSSSCTAHSLIKGVQILTGFQGSEHVLYSLTGTLEGENPPADDGRQCVDCLTVVSTQGVHPFEGNSPDGRNSDIWTANDTSAEPPNVCLPATPAETANLTKFALGANSIDPAASNLSDLLASCLAAKGIVYLGTEIGQAFEQLQGATVAQPDPNANDPNGGGHALIIVGYRTMADGSRQFKVQNSWGETWDENGECWASLAWCAACWELHPLLPIPSGPPSTQPAPPDPDSTGPQFVDPTPPGPLGPAS
jgi:C1A family cysteine protease